MRLIEEIRQRAIDAKTLKENDEKLKTYLDTWYTEYVEKIRYFADLGWNECNLDIKDEYGCLTSEYFRLSSYIMKRLISEGFEISNVSNYEIYSHDKPITGVNFKVSW